MSDTVRHDDLSSVTTPELDDHDLPLHTSLTAPMTVTRRARQTPKPSGTTDSAFERALLALENALEAAICDAAGQPLPRRAMPTPVTRLMPQTGLIEPEAPAPVAAKEPARTIEPKFAPQEDIGDGDPSFVQPEYERVAPMPTPVQPAKSVYVSSIPPLLLAADAALRMREAAKAVINALPRVELPVIDMPTVDLAVPDIKVPEMVTVAPPVVEAVVAVAEPVAAPKAEPVTAAAPEVDPYLLYPFGKATLRLMVM